MHISLWNLFTLLMIAWPGDWNRSIPAMPNSRAHASLAFVARFLELTDPRESFGTNYDWHLGTVRGRWRLLNNAPHAMDGFRFADRYTAVLGDLWATSFYAYWLESPPTWRENVRMTALRDLRHAHLCWALLHRATNPETMIHDRRQSLRDLQFRLGESDYFTGTMPEPITQRCLWEK